MNRIEPKDIKSFLQIASNLMAENRDYLIELDQRAGDGDLGVTMAAGFAAMAEQAAALDEPSCGKLFMRLGMTLNEAAPSSLGTILSIFFSSGGRAVREETALDVKALAAFVRAGIGGIMQRAKSKPGERTVLDSLAAGADALERAVELESGVKAAAEAARAGMEATKDMAPVHGRAVYHADKIKGEPDGGAVVGWLIFEAMARAFA